LALEGSILALNGFVIVINGRKFTFSNSPRWNVAPNQKVPVIVPTNGDESYQVVEMTWGFKNSFGAPLANGKSEILLSKKNFLKHLDNRCLIPADGFYEWTHDKTTIMFTKPNDEPFCFAGEFQTIRGEQNFLILTTSPNQAVAKVHDRMPFIVQAQHYGRWLDKGELFESVLKNPEKEELNCYPVQRDLNNVRNDGPESIRPTLNNQKEL
jgi:putative SOS response-associated peptidase YedK